MATLPGDRYPVKHDGVAFRVLDDLSSIAVDAASGEAHALTAVATAVFERCDGTMSAGQIVDEIVDIFDAPREDVERDVIAFLDDLADRGLIDW